MLSNAIYYALQSLITSLYNNVVNHILYSIFYKEDVTLKISLITNQASY